MKRTGQLNLIEAACYPRDASPANTGLAPPPTADQYPSVVLSTDKVHIKLGKSFSAHNDAMVSSCALLAFFWEFRVPLLGVKKDCSEQ